MTEKPPSFEQRGITEQEVIQALKEKGLRDREALRLHQQWIEQEWEKLPKDPLELIRFNQRRARLYRAAGHLNEAYKMLLDAREQLLGEPRQDTRSALYTEITGELEELDKA